ncbi:MAG: GNAT family N-acetyltransferase [Bacteroidetes bacterium]|nr:GNAT family N-acetyltransferase [Bacteroidota bacterium]
MNNNILSVEELKPSTIPMIVKYWLESDAKYLMSLGVDLKKLPSGEKLTGMLMQQLELPLALKKSYCIIWMLNDKPVGHSNLNPVTFGEEAFMHLHLWNSDERNKGLGIAFLKLTIPVFFSAMQIKKLYCEPYALNDAPNKILNKFGFNFVKEYITTPGSLNFEQSVKRWELSADDFKFLNNT